jgi:hypothetical protein
MMEPACSSESLVQANQSTRCHNQEAEGLNTKTQVSCMLILFSYIKSFTNSYRQVPERKQQGIRPKNPNIWPKSCI